MISESDLKALICQTSINLLASCNSHYTTYRNGMLRGLVWCLKGEDPGGIEGVEELSQITGIPHADLVG